MSPFVVRAGRTSYIAAESGSLRDSTPFRIRSIDEEGVAKTESVSAS